MASFYTKFLTLLTLTIGCTEPDVSSLNTELEMSYDSGEVRYELRDAAGATFFGTVNSTFSDSMSVILSKDGKAAVNELVTFEVTKGDGASLSMPEALTDSDGLASVQFTGGETAGTYRVSANHPASGLTVQFLLIANAETFLMDATAGSTMFGTVGTAFDDKLAIVLMNGSAPMPNELISYSVESGEGAALSLSETVTNADGIASVTFTAGPGSGTYKVRARHADTNLSVLFLLVASEQKSPTLSIIGGNFQVGGLEQEFSNALEVRLLAGNGQPMVGETVTFTLRAGGGALGSTSATTSNQGLAGITYTSGTDEGTVIIDASHASTQLTQTFTLFSQSTIANKVVKIVEAGVGNQPEITNRTLDVSTDALNMKAALYNAQNSSYISDVSVVWTSTGGNYTSDDFVGNTAGSTSITFNPTKTGATVIQATYTGGDTSVIAPSDVTATITTTNTLVPAIVAVTAGDGQSGIVNNNLAQPLKVRVTTANGTPVPGEGVIFTSVQGAGSVLSEQPVITNGDGYAEASVKLSTLASLHIFRATLASNTALSADFSATATPGAASKLAFIRQPADCFAAFQCLTQPQVVIRDAFDNAVTGTIANISINVTNGAGSLSGNNATSGISTVSGVGIFTDLTYSDEGTGVILTASATGLSSAATDPFNVGPGLVSACSLQDIDWKTMEGGCKDMSSNLVWSARSENSMSWDSAIWDAFADGGSGAAEVETSDGGRTNEYQTNGYEFGRHTVRDASSAAYCHGLVEGGKSDWRLPTMNEIVTASANGMGSHVSGVNTWLWTQDYNNEARPKIANGSNGGVNESWKTHHRFTICVRSDIRSTLTALAFTSLPPTFVVNEVGSAIVVGTVDEHGGQITAEGIPVTIAVVGESSGISGTLTKNTNSAGQAVFDDITFDTAAQVTLSATATGIASPTTNNSTIVGQFPGSCGAPNDAFTSESGGCRQSGTNIVWSRPSEQTMSWFAAIWDAFVFGSGEPEASDGGWTNEYPVSTTDTPCYVGSAYCDTDPAAYCHDLVEGGFSDWAMPSQDQLTGAVAAGLNEQVLYPNESYLVTRRNWNGNRFIVRFSDGAVYENNSNQRVICYRSLQEKPNSAKLTPSLARTKGLTDSTFDLSFRVQTTSSATVHQEGVNVTLSKASGTGNLGGTLTSTTNAAGVAYFDDLTHDTSEYITLSVTNDAGLTNPSPIAVNVSLFPGACVSESTQWSTADGGCKSLQSGVVYSAQSAARYTYSQAHNYCDNLIEGGYSDWRLINIEEAQALVDNIPDPLTYAPTLYDRFKYDRGSSANSQFNVFNGAAQCCGDGGHEVICVRN